VVRAVAVGLAAVVVRVEGRATVRIQKIQKIQKIQRTRLKMNEKGVDVTRPLRLAQLSFSNWDIGLKGLPR
jgi:hypothetical protein